MLLIDDQGAKVVILHNMILLFGFNEVFYFRDEFKWSGKGCFIVISYISLIQSHFAMNHKNLKSLILLLIFLSACSPKSPELKTASSGGYEYNFVENDPLKVRIYKLKNGLTVYLSKYQSEPRISTNIVVRAGGKNDPSDATGLAHYLEHIMFKGTADFGTLNWEKEKPLLDSIEFLFESYRKLTDSSERVSFYKKIDQVSSLASSFAIANEYDKIVSGIGASRTNAYTTEDRTVYMNDIPANQLESWLKIEGNRFKTIIPRLFHTELEAVYEEKNRSLDNDYWKSAETKYAALFPAHPYGTQTVIGTIDHLKNPSIREIKNYFETYYRPNNVAICMSGDLDYDKTITMIDRYFGEWQPNDQLPVWKKPEEKPITSPIVKEVIGPDAEWVEIAYRFNGRNSSDYSLLMLTNLILSNSQAGLIDLNLRQEQKVLDPFSYVDAMNDYSVHTLTARPRAGQSLDEVKDLLLEQIEKVKKGEFEDWLLPAILNDFKKGDLMSGEDNYSRVSQMVLSYSNGIPWNERVGFLTTLKKISKDDIIRFASEHYQDNYVLLYKRTGKDPNAKKITKPAITPVTLNKEQKSPFHLSVLEAKVDPISPVFLNYETDINRASMKSDIEVLSTTNIENDLFTLYYLTDAGTDNDPITSMAIEYLQYIGSTRLDAASMKKEFYKLGCSVGVSAGSDQTYVYLSGLSENMDAALELFEELLADPREDAEALKKMVEGILKQREDVQKDKGAILWSGLVNYGLYGPNSSLTNLLTNEELLLLKPSDLTPIIRRLNQVQHRVLYYGPMKQDQLVNVLNKRHRTPEKLLPLPQARKFEMVDMSKPKVYWTNYDMVQAEIVLVSKGDVFDPSVSASSGMFNEYFGGNMSSPVFQELRERRGLAYAAWAGYNTAGKKGDHNYLFAYIGTQADKQKESMKAMLGLMNEFPRSESGFEVARKAMMSRISTERITKTGVLFNYESAKRLGIDYDLRKEVFEGIQKMTIDDVAAFHKKNVSGKKFNVVVIGDKNRLDLKSLSSYGEVQELTTSELFGFTRPKAEQVKVDR